MTPDIEERLLAMISERCDVPVEELRQETSLEDLGFDSLVLVELAMKLRKEFGVVASDDDLTFVDTVGDLVDAVSKAMTA